MAGSALANGDSQQYGYLEVCKYSTASNPVSGSFQFKVDGQTVNVATGGCSSDMKVPAGNNTVIEASNPYTVETETDTIPVGDLVASNLTTRQDTVWVPASSDISKAVTVDYTNTEQFGTTEICKSAALGSGLTGTFTFDVTGPMGFSKAVSVPVGACSASFRVPAGDDEVDEVGSNNTDVVGISTIPSNDLVADNLAAGTSEIWVAPGTDVNNETVETFVNSTSHLKICKVAGSQDLVGTVYSFTANGQTVQAVAEPGAGGCVLVPTPFPGGTVVNVQEGISPGTTDSSIAVSDNRAVPGSTNLATRSVSLTLGSGETVVTYTNVDAAPGLLKVCKNAGAGVAVGTEFNFTVGTEKLQVPAGYCVTAGDFAFDSTQTITEAPTAGLAVIGEAVDPAVDEVSETLSTGVVQALVGMGVTEVTFTNATASTPALPVNTTGGIGTGSLPAPVVIPTTTPPAPVIPGPVIYPVHHKPGKCVLYSKVKGSWLSLWTKGGSCHVLLKETDNHGKKIGSMTRYVKSGHVLRVSLNHRVRHVKASVVR
jgi:hypothetical protein